MKLTFKPVPIDLDEEFYALIANNDELKPTVINILQSSKLKDLRSINTEDLIESKSILINENILPILKIALSNCDHILEDFQKDLNELSSHCEIVRISNEKCFLAIVINKGYKFSYDLRNKINDLINNYQNKKLKYSSVGLNANKFSSDVLYLFNLIDYIKLLLLKQEGKF